MLSREIERRLERLLAVHQQGIITEDELASQLGTLASGGSIDSLLERLPTDLVGIAKRGIALDNQEAADHEFLRPEASPFDAIAKSDHYYRHVAAALLEPGDDEHPVLLSVVCLPSFDPEWALRLLDKESGYSLILNRAETQIYGSLWDPQPAAVAIRREQAILSQALAAELRVAWRKMLRRVRHAERAVFGADGETYHFTCWERGMGCMAGRTWSPEPETAPGRLVALSHLLSRYVVADDEQRTGLSDEIRQSVEWFSRFPG
jgi:hypothetical protein